MQNVIILLAFSVVDSGHAAFQMDAVNPIEKVIEMIGDLEQKVIKEGEAAQKTYDEFAEWCEDQSKDLGFEIKTAKTEIEDLQATIEKASADIAAEEEKIGQYSSEISRDEADLKAATAIREKENGIFVTEEKELMEAVDILSRAVGILERELGSGASLAQMQHTTPGVLDSLRAVINMAKINDVDTSKLSALLQTQHQAASKEDEDDSELDSMLGAPDPAVFKSNAGGIVATINDLLEDAKKELQECRKKEITNKHNFELLELELKDAISFNNKELDEAKKAKAEAAEVKSVAEGDLSVTSKELAETTKQLGSIHHDCMTKAEEFEITMSERGAELKALAEAKKIIIEATGGATEQTYGLEQTGTSFLQVASNSKVNNANQQAVILVRNLARKLHSPVLAQLAQRLQAAARYAARYGTKAGEDPFAKVKGLIKDMIAKLLKEAEEEASQKAFCDKEMGETKAKKEELTDEIEKLTTKIDK